MCQWLSHVKVVHGHCLPNWQSWQSWEPWQWVRRCLPNSNHGSPGNGSGTQAGRIPVGQAHRLAGYHCVKPTGWPDATVSSPQAVGSQLARQIGWPDLNGPSAQVGPQVTRIPAVQGHRLAGFQLARPTGWPDPSWPSTQLCQAAHVCQAHTGSAIAQAQWLQMSDF